MRIPTRKHSRSLHFNITPLIDVVFLLIIFFLVASHFVRNERAEGVELPTATQGKDEEESPHRVVVTLTADRNMSVAGNAVSLDQVEQMLSAIKLDNPQQEPELRIRADRTVPYEDVEPLLLGAAKAGVTKVRFAVLPD